MRRPLVSTLGTLCRSTASISAVVLLVAAAWYGHRTDWRFGFAAAPAEVPGTRAQVDAVVDRSRGIIRFADRAAAEKFGVEVAPVWVTAVQETLHAAGELTLDPYRIARLSSRFDGVVAGVRVKVGDQVSPGDPLFVIDSTEAGKLRADVLKTALSSRLRKEVLAGVREAGAAVPGSKAREAEALAADADLRLQSSLRSLAAAGIALDPKSVDHATADELTTALRSAGLPTDVRPKTATLWTLRSSAAGVVLAADAVAGEVCTAGRTLAVVADPSTLRLVLHMPMSESPRLQKGQAIHFKADGGSEFDAKLEDVGLAADETTRTVPVHASVPNADGRLRAGLLGTGAVVVRTIDKAMTSPRNGVQRAGGKDVVFVRDPEFLKDDSHAAFTAKPVVTGVVQGDLVQVVEGVGPEDVLVSKGADRLARLLESASETAQ